jgi:ABC-type proline/glycine betaine transport system substrate-binding protein
VARKDWVAQAPPSTLEVLRRMHLGLEAVAEMDYRVNAGKLSARDAARSWMQEHRELVESWFGAK